MEQGLVPGVEVQIVRQKGKTYIIKARNSFIALSEDILNEIIFIDD